MRSLLRILCPDWVCVPLTIVSVLVVSNLVLTYRAGAATAPSSCALSGDRQASGPIGFWVDERFSPPEVSAIRAGFATWQRDPASDVTFVFMGTTPTPDRAVEDGRNVVVRSARPVVVETKTALAMTRRSVAEGTSFYRDADVIIDFSGRVPWSLDGVARAQDLQSVVTHEVGHLLGLDHVTDPSQVMYPINARGRVDRRELRWGDRAGVAEVYPARSAASGPGIGSRIQ